MLGAEQARQRAALIIARVKAGEAPVPEPMAAKLAGGPTVAELARRFLEEHVAVRYKPRSITPTRSVVNRYIVPEFGRLPLEAVERAHVTELQHRLHQKPCAANMVVGTLSLMYRLAEGWGLVPEGCNPCRSVTRYPQRKRERFLTDTEFTRLGKVLDDVDTEGGASASAVAALRLLMLTGCRKSEILTLRWEYVAARCERIETARRQDRRSGRSLVTVGREASRRSPLSQRQSVGHSRSQARHAYARS